jgi:hypothetical protein
MHLDLNQHCVNPEATVETPVEKAGSGEYSKISATIDGADQRSSIFPGDPNVCRSLNSAPSSSWLNYSKFGAEVCL